MFCNQQCLVDLYSYQLHTCVVTSEQQHLMEARAEVVLISTTLKDPAAGVVTVVDERVGLPEVKGWVWWC